LITFRQLAGVRVERLLADVQRRRIPEDALGDHIDPTALPGIAQASPHATIVVPGVAREKVVGLGVPAERVVVPPVDERMAYGPLTVTAIPAAREELDYSPEQGYPYLGYMLQLNGVRLYHAGDCTMYDGLTERL
jgi:L-ascorbate metabolism protein UlaG (beta-lactamase superfamily)